MTWEQNIPDHTGFGSCCRVVAPEQTFDLGSRTATLLQGGESLMLFGALGAGKTCFVQGLCRALGVHDEVTSPTFTLVNRYVGKLVVYHLDLYRIEPTDNLSDIGLDDILDEVFSEQAVLVAEWPQLLLPLIPERQELLVVPGVSATERDWYLRGIPTLPDAWERMLNEYTEGP